MFGEKGVNGVNPQQLFGTMDLFRQNPDSAKF